MDVRITVNYFATDGRMPESVDVVFENADPGQIGAALPPVLEMLLTAPSARDRAVESAEREWTRLFGDLPAPVPAPVSTPAPERDGRPCLRVDCGHIADAHAVVQGLGGAATITDCAGCAPLHMCSGFVGTMPARLTAATAAHRGEVMAADTNGHVRPAVDARAAILLGNAAEAFRPGDALDWLPPASANLYGSWVRKGDQA